MPERVAKMATEVLLETTMVWEHIQLTNAANTTFRAQSQSNCTTNTLQEHARTSRHWPNEVTITMSSSIASFQSS